MSDVQKNMWTGAQERQTGPVQQPMTGPSSRSVWSPQPTTGEYITHIFPEAPGWREPRSPIRPPQRPPDDHERIKRITAAAALLLSLIITSLILWQQRANFMPQQGQVNQASTPKITEVPAVLNTITNNKNISPFLFGTNMALFHANDEPLLYSAQTRQMLRQIGVRIIRMPTRTTLSPQTEVAAAQAIKDIGAAPLVVMSGPEFKGGSILASDMKILSLITPVFGKEPTYFEFGNESDLQGITVDKYVAAWNQVIPVLKQHFPTARFIGPDNYQFDRRYLKTFVAQAKPLPDGVSWHEYACSIHWTAQVCLQDVDAWNVHFTQARAAMQEAIGVALPIWVTEWNYASDTNDQLVNDGKSNNPAFMQAWTEKAMQTLVANRVFAAMQYFSTATPMPLVSNDQIGIEGQIFQQEYQKVMVDGYTPPPPVITYPTPTTAVNPQEAFSFENGTTGGWVSIGPGITQPINTTTRAFDGTHSLAITLNNASENDTPFLSIDANQLASLPKPGQMITAYIYVANPDALVNAKIFVANSQHGWLFANSLTLTSGQWNKLWYSLPLDFTDHVTQIGIQFFTSRPGISSPVYIDAINWQ